MIEQVKRGAELLDRVEPDWHNHINVADFDLRSTSTCIIVQLFGGYCAGLMQLGILGDSQDKAYGFDVIHCGRTLNEIEADYNAGHAAWLAEIKQRKEAR